MGNRPTRKNFVGPARVLEALVPARLFEGLSIGRKMLLGYLLPGALTVVVAGYVLFSLQRLNGLNQSIVKTDIAAQEAADKMVDALLAQDFYEQRYLILKDRETRGLFDARGYEFQAQLSLVKGLPGGGLPLEGLEEAHLRYSGLFRQETLLVERGEADRARKFSEREMKKANDGLIAGVKALSAAARRSQDRKRELIASLGARAFLTTLVLCAFSLLAGALAGLAVTGHITAAVHRLEVATARISEGDFAYDPQIKSRDELGALAGAFVAMGRRLKKLEEMYVDASPLTRLPGGIAIENVLKKRLESGRPLAFCLLDLDNFKSFNDRYGYVSGSEVIKETARIIEAAVKALGAPEDFVGHIGGDDFALISTPERARPVAEEIIARFDARIPDFYGAEDRERGYILARSRQGAELKFPVMTISIACVTNERRKLTDPVQVSEIAAEMKKYAKSIPKSVFAVDRRMA